jgi:uncharacterized protein YbcC (UPF0753/DUF2309 family)
MAARCAPGLPWQSVHDGEGYAHDPLRLSVCIEAPSRGDDGDPEAP